MSRLRRYASRLLSVPYRPDPDAQLFLARAQTREEPGLVVTVAVLSDLESKRFFGVRLAHRGMQPVWIRVCNRSEKSLRLELFRIDPNYYTPLEASYINHFAVGKRLLSFGLLAWLFLPLLPLVLFKWFGASAANRRMDAFFKSHGFPGGFILRGKEKSGFVFTALDEGEKSVEVALAAGDQIHEFAFSLEVPGLALDGSQVDASVSSGLKEVDEAALRLWLERQPRATTNQRGGAEGDPLNLVVIGSLATVRQCLGARWDDAETIDLATSWKAAKAFLLGSEYRYSPVSPLYLAGKRQEFALQRARASINERIHLRLWRTGLAFEGQPVWIGQISRDIGVRFTLKTWNLTTHKIDPDVDEARDYLIDDLLEAHQIARVGHVGGVGATPESAPRRNLTGDPYFTDGQRAVAVLSGRRAAASFFSWD